MLKKLRLKFILINMGIVTAMLLIIFGLVYHFTRTDLEKQSTSMLQSLEQSMDQPDWVYKPEQQMQLPYFTIQISLRGDVVASGYSYYDLTDAVFLQTLIQHVNTAQATSGTIEAYDLMYSKVPLIGGQKLIFVDISSQRAALTSLVEASILIGVVSLLAFLGISILLAKWAIKPVQRAWEQQRQFVSYASHELKTPLTVIMSNAELLQSPDCDPESRSRFSQSILTMSHQMRSLVEGMLELARADNGYTKSFFTRLDCSKLVRDAMLPFEPVMFEKGLTLDSCIEPGITVTGCEQHLKQLVDILLDNAGKYSAPGIVMVTLQRHGRGRCLLTVSNPGQPIAKADLEKIFQRFYRGDEARSRTGSFGLGLSIARNIAQEHHGKIWAQSNETGNCFCVQLPCE